MKAADRFFVYIVMNQSGTTLYIGVTNDLARRVGEHERGQGSEFTRQYHLERLIYFEVFDSVRQAIAREKQLKGWRREKKEKLIRSANPQLRDLSDEAIRHSA